MKKNLAIIGATEFQNPLILKAKELGFETYVFAWKTGDVGEKTADHFIPLDVKKKEEIYQYCTEKNIIAAVSIASDITQLTTNYIQRKLGKPCNSENTDIIATNKYKMRKAFKAAGIKCPGFIEVSSTPAEEDLKELKYPLIIKPTDRSGSRGIYKANNYNELCEKIKNSIDFSFEKKAIIEEFFDGQEYSCETISYNGKHSALAVTKKYTTGAPNFIGTGHQEPSDIDIRLLPSIYNEIYKALDSLGIKHGASHSEFRLQSDGTIRIIEIGPRMGGDFIGSDLVYLSTGIDFMKLVIDISVGNIPNIPIVSFKNKVRIDFVFTEKDLEHYKEAKRKYTFIREDIDYNRLSCNVTNSTDRHGYYIYLLDNYNHQLNG